MKNTTIERLYYLEKLKSRIKKKKNKNKKDYIFLKKYTYLPYAIADNTVKIKYTGNNKWGGEKINIVSFEGISNSRSGKTTTLKKCYFTENSLLKYGDSMDFYNFTTV